MFVCLYTVEYINETVLHTDDLQLLFSILYFFLLFFLGGLALFIHPGVNAERGKCSRKIEKNW